MPRRMRFGLNSFRASLRCPFQLRIERLAYVFGITRGAHAIGFTPNEAKRLQGAVRRAVAMLRLNGAPTLEDVSGGEFSEGSPPASL